MSSGRLEVRVARPEELEAAFSVRRDVFCREQGLFRGDDRDEHDRDAVHLVALSGGAVIGTVRLYERSPGVWVGGRLAVDPSHRGAAGFRLVRTAVEVAAARGARVFLAAVQSRNERFFRRLGWRTVGSAAPVAGHAHVLMAAPLPAAEAGARAS